MNNLNSRRSNNCLHYINHEDYCSSYEAKGCTRKENCVEYFIYQLGKEVKALFSKKNLLDGYEFFPFYHSHYIMREEEI